MKKKKKRKKIKCTVHYSVKYLCCNDRTEKHFNKCLITSLGSDSVCELTDLDNFDIKKSHIHVYIALQQKCVSSKGG